MSAPDNKPRGRARILADDDRRKWRDEITARLVALEKSWRGAIAKHERATTERERTTARREFSHHLSAALRLCQQVRPLPEVFFKVLDALLTARLPQGPDMHARRWFAVHEARYGRWPLDVNEHALPETGPVKPIRTWREAYVEASAWLSETPDKGSAAAMKYSYDLIQRQLKDKPKQTRKVG